MSSVVYQTPTSSTGWVAAPLRARRQASYAYLVWYDGTNYRADTMKGSSTVDATGTDATVIQTAITNA
ncbi:MAG TPA: hypothetical protein VFE98_02945 [Candidatus Bathyarchaeia archaeon]|nr:hypothetical protein [Candidatus Bathyarchaeia archaeon]